MDRWYNTLDKTVTKWFLREPSRHMFNLIAGAALLFMLSTTVVTVIVRKLPIQAGWIIGGYEYTQLGMAILAVFAISWTWYTGGHIRIGLMRDKLNLKARVTIDTIGTLLGMFFVVAIIWGMWRVYSTSVQFGRVSELSEIPLATFQLVFTILMAYFLLVLLRSFIAYVSILLGFQADRSLLFGGVD